MQQKLERLDALRDRLRGAIETLKEKDQCGSRAKELLAKVGHLQNCIYSCCDCWHGGY